MTVQEAGLGSDTDAEILAFAAAEGRVAVSHDVRTMTLCATARLHAEQPMAGLILIAQAHRRFKRNKMVIEILPRIHLAFLKFKMRI